VVVFCTPNEHLLSRPVLMVVLAPTREPMKTPNDLSTPTSPALAATRNLPLEKRDRADVASERRRRRPPPLRRAPHSARHRHDPPPPRPHVARALPVVAAAATGHAGRSRLSREMDQHLRLPVLEA
jgi:hypothetical protein